MLPGPSRLHELHESKLPFASLIEIIRSNLPLLFVHITGICSLQVPRERVSEFSAGFSSLAQPDYANKTYQLGLVEALRVSTEWREAW